MTRFKLLKYLVLPVFLFCFSNYFSQSKLTNAQLTSTWQLLATSNGVEVYAQKSNCNLSKGQLPLEFVFLKMVNTSNSPVMVNYLLASLYKEGCVGCDANPETAMNVMLEAGETKTATCETNVPGLQVLINNPNLKKGWDFQAIQLNSFKVTTK